MVLNEKSRIEELFSELKEFKEDIISINGKFGEQITLLEDAQDAADDSI